MTDTHLSRAKTSISALYRIHLQYRRPWLDFWVGKIHWRRDRLPTPVFLGFPCCGSAGKESTCNAGDLGLIPGFGRSPGEGNSYPLQYSGLENSMDCKVHGLAKSWTRLSNFHYLYNGLQETKILILSLPRLLPKEKQIILNTSYFYLLEEKGIHLTLQVG